MIPSDKKRLHLRLQGLLQGIGFRPFVYRLAVLHQQTGWVANDHQHVVIEIEGDPRQQTAFLADLQTQLPGCGKLVVIKSNEINCLNDKTFELKASLQTDDAKSAFVCPDLAVCPACVAELVDPRNRRYLHPFISCCHCGPRYSVMRRLPYDRCNTAMADFPLCETCLAEYQNPADRRFHAQTIACPDCGPQLAFHAATGQLLTTRRAALDNAIAELKAGNIIAIKGLGGFQLLVDATNSAAVLRLRQRKHRSSKPFAVMVGSLADAEKLATLSDLERHSLQSSAAPIVLVLAKKNQALAPAVAPLQALLGLMLPYTPLHHLLMRGLQRPVIATSGNAQDEPICIDNAQAFEKLAGIADFFLCHDRPILRALDDSIVRIIANKNSVLRRARGYVPTPIALQNPLPVTLAVGGQLKNTVAIAQNGQVILSQHLGDLSAWETQQHFHNTINDLSAFYACQPVQMLCDAHPDYASSQYAHQQNLPVQTVQHHVAHIFSGMAEHQLAPPVLGVAWDGTGLGTDNALWGGEFFNIAANRWTRMACLRPFALVGGGQAIKEPRRAALGLLFGCFGEALFTAKHAPLLTAFSAHELAWLQTALQKSLNCPLTSSVGRLFDAVASLLNLCQVIEFEGQAAMALEQLAMQSRLNLPGLNYALPLIDGELLYLDWQPLILALLADVAQLPPADIAAKFHWALAQAAFAVLERARADFSQTDCPPVVFSGGCFQNAYLVQAIEIINKKYNYRLFFQQQVPANDGGIALGQIFAATLC